MTKTEPLPIRNWLQKPHYAIAMLEQFFFAPHLGDDTHEVLGGLGYSASEITDFVDSNVVMHTRASGFAG